MLNEFHDAAKQAMQDAIAAVDRFAHDHLAPEHLLLGLCANPASGACALLGDLGVNASDLAAALEAKLQPGTKGESGTVPWTPDTKHALARAMRVAVELGDRRVDSVHLLLGVAAVERGPAAETLRPFGVDESAVRGAVEGREQVRQKGPKRTVLFLCSGNYFRSRFAEHLFNEVAPRLSAHWRAISRGFRPGPGNVGPMAAEALAELERLDIAVPQPVREPAFVTAEELAAADRIIALKDAEHRAMFREYFPEWEGEAEFWTIHDRDVVTPAETLSSLHTAVSELALRLAVGG